MAQLGHYSALDRLLHRLAFAGSWIQLAAADCEDALFGADIAGVQSSRPIFITSLPRAGTTILLSLLARMPGLATHRYRDMPFVMAPLLWSRLSGAHRRSAGDLERAHGDGLRINLDSPEAFEEVIWRAFWPHKYGSDGIQCWDTNDANAEAEAFIRSHHRKIVALRSGDRSASGRYLSKNNANISRIELIASMMPDATIVIPVRNPLDHAASLLKQHRNFLDIHRRDAFSREYMADIGHYEFGQLHRPILFPGVEEIPRKHDPLEINYWLAYWIAAFEYLWHRRHHVLFVNYEALCDDGAGTLRRISERLGIETADNTAMIGRELKRPEPHDELTAAAQPALRDRTIELHGKLLALSCC